MKSKLNKNKLTKGLFLITLLVSLFTFQGIKCFSPSLASSATHTELVVHHKQSITKRPFSFLKAKRSYFATFFPNLTHPIQFDNRLAYDQLAEIDYKNARTSPGKPIFLLFHLKTIPQSSTADPLS